MGHAIIRGETYDEKFASANKALQQLERRISMRSIVAPLTPIIIMGYCKEDEDGVIARGMLPVSGFITKVSLYIGRLEDPEFIKKDVLRFYIKSCQVDGTIISKEFLSKKLSIEEFSNFKVAVDSRIAVAINVKAFDIWYGFVMEPEAPIHKIVEFEDNSESALTIFETAKIARSL